MLLESSAERSVGFGSGVLPRSTWRAIFSFPVVLAALLVALTFITVRSRFDDPDLWYHLKIGQVIWNTHSIPRIDTFSFTANGHPWVAQEWLSQVAYYGIYKFAGYTGLMLALCVLASSIVVAVFLLSAWYSGNVKVAFLAGLITWLFSTVGFAIRPHMIGYLFLVCELLVLQAGRSRSSKWFLALPLLFAAWVNFHGSFFFGLIVLALVLFCSFFQIEWGLIVSRRWETGPRNMLGLVLVCSLAAIMVNPLGFKLAFNPIEAVGRLPVAIAQVSEWQPPHFNEIRGFGLLAVAALIFLVPLLRRSELFLDELLLTALVFGFAILHERMVFVFGIIAAPVLCRLLADSWDRYEPDRDRPLPNAVLILASLLACFFAFPSRHILDIQIESGSPVNALNYIKHSGLSGPMMNEYVYGGYLIWAAPQYKVFIDGRADIFEQTGVLTEYGDWIRVNADPKLLLDKYRINFCLLSRDAPVTHVIALLPGWRLIYSDHLSVVFAKQT